MKLYFINGTFHITRNSAHNKAQKIVLNYNHCIADEKRLQDLIKSFTSEIEHINKLNKRCKDIKLEYHKLKLPEHELYIIAVENNFYLTCTPIKRLELSEKISLSE